MIFRLKQNNRPIVLKTRYKLRLFIFTSDLLLCLHGNQTDNGVNLVYSYNLYLIPNNCFLSRSLCAMLYMLMDSEML